MSVVRPSVCRRDETMWSWIARLRVLHRRALVAVHGTLLKLALAFVLLDCLEGITPKRRSSPSGCPVVSHSQASLGVCV